MKYIRIAKKLAIILALPVSIWVMWPMLDELLGGYSWWENTKMILYQFWSYVLHNGIVQKVGAFIENAWHKAALFVQKTVK